MKYIKATLLTLLLQSIMFNALANEDCDFSRRWWYNIGLGVGTTFNDGNAPIDVGIASHTSFNGMLNENLFLTFETTHMSKGGYDHPKVRDGGVLLGYRSKKPNWYWSGAAGLGIYEMERDYGGWRSWTQEKTALGIPVEGQLFWTPAKHFGFGLIAHAMVGGDTYGALLLAFQIS